MMKLFITLFLILFPFAVAAAQDSSDWQAVEKVFGRKGTEEGSVFKVTFPRSDLEVKVGGISIDPGLALTSWIAFEQVKNQVIMMGDLVLLEGEISPVINKLVSNNIEITALHNHLTDESPCIMYMHFSG